MNIRLRTVTEDDIPVFFEQQNDPGAHVMVGITSHAPDDKTAYFKKWERIMPDEEVNKKTILVNDEIAGNISCFFAPWSESREVGYWLGRDYWGKGVATKALLEFLKIENRRPLHATVAKHNEASIAVLLKCGFHQMDGFKEITRDDGSVIVEARFKLDPEP